MSTFELGLSFKSDISIVVSLSCCILDIISLLGGLVGAFFEMSAFPSRLDLTAVQTKTATMTKKKIMLVPPADIPIIAPRLSMVDETSVGCGEVVMIGILSD